MEIELKLSDEEYKELSDITLRSIKEAMDFILELKEAKGDWRNITTSGLRMMSDQTLNKILNELKVDW